MSEAERRAAMEVLDRVTEWVIQHYAGGPAWDERVKKLYQMRASVFGLEEVC